jgi:two-component system, OmpR family, sensor kinase
MKTLPIRLRLTLWNCFIFGTIIVIVTSVVYYAHRQAHYKDVDMMLKTITSHVHEEIGKQLDKGRSLENVQVSIDELGLDQIAVMIRDRSGKLIETNDHPFFGEHKLLNGKLDVSQSFFQTITDNKGIRIRVLTTPFHRKGVIAGYIQTLYSLKDLDQSLQKFQWMVISLTAIGIIFAFFAAWFLAKKTLARVDLIRKTANAIAVSQDFQQRVLHIGPSDELGKLTETFNHMLDSLEKAYTNQKRFLTDASHELRAPLTTIRGNLDILHKIKNISEEEKEEIITDIRNEAIRMSKLVADLLSLARADAGQKARKDIINLSSISEGVMSEIDSWEKNIKINSYIEENVYIFGDEAAIKQLMIILIDNAIKYSFPNGTVSLFVTKENNQAVIHVKDKGIGIGKAELPFLFERFYRTDEAKRHSQDGTGLGLAIAKSIVDDHGGSILLKSNLQEGSEFTIQFNLIKEK